MLTLWFTRFLSVEKLRPAVSTVEMDMLIYALFSFYFTPIGFQSDLEINFKILVIV